jgi:hypothetical protein
MRMLSQKDLVRKGIKYHPGHLHRLIKAGVFPRPTKLGTGTIGPNFWPEFTVDEWLTERVRKWTGQPSIGDAA